MANFLQSEVIQTIVLPFVLIFTLLFAILEKSNLLGPGKKQVNAIISFVIAAIFVTFSTQVNWIRQFSVFLAIGIVILFVLMLIWSFAVGTTKGDPFENYTWMKSGIGWVAIIAVVAAALVITGYWSVVSNYLSNPDSGSNIIFIVLIVAAIAWVLSSGKSEEKKDKKD